MRPLNNATHLIASLAVTAAAVLAAFAIPTPARAITITFGDDGNPMVVGSGKEARVHRQVAAFSALRMDGSIDVDAHPGAEPGITIVADDNIAPLVETTVENGTLAVRLRPGASFRTSLKMRVVVEFANLAETHQHGSGDLHVTALNGPRLVSTITGSGDLHVDDAQVGTVSIDVAGSGDVRIAGHADQAHYGISGSGDIDAGKLVARRVDVNVHGSGDAQVDATDALDAHVAGSGDVTYGGHPHDVQRRVSGSGSVEAR